MHCAMVLPNQLHTYHLYFSGIKANSPWWSHDQMTSTTHTVMSQTIGRSCVSIRRKYHIKPSCNQTLLSVPGLGLVDRVESVVYRDLGLHLIHCQESTVSTVGVWQPFGIGLSKCNESRLHVKPPECQPGSLTDALVHYITSELYFTCLLMKSRDNTTWFYDRNGRPIRSYSQKDRAFPRFSL